MRSTLISIGCIVVGLLVACGDDDAAPGAASSSGGATSGGGSTSSGASTSGGSTTSGGNTTPPTPPEKVQAGPPAGNPDGKAEVPLEGGAEKVSNPTKVIGTGTPESCTAADFVAAVRAGGVITFNCGPDPATITLTEPAKVYNDTPKVVIDGGNKITLSGGGKTRILHMASCDKTLGGWPPAPGDCNTSAASLLVVQNITLVDANTSDLGEGQGNPGGGAAIYAQGGRLKVINARFFNNKCKELGSDLGGAAIRKLDYFKELPAGAGPARPVWVVNSTFGGAEGYGNTCANGGALSSIHASWNIINSHFSHNTATGNGANSGEGGNGGAIYNDGNEIVMKISGSYFHDNKANEGGSAVFFVSNDKSGTITLIDSKFERHPKGKFETFFGFFVKAKEEATIINTPVLR